MSQPYHYKNAEQSKLNDTQPFICQLSSKKSGKPTAKDGTSTQTTAFLSTQNTDLMSHPKNSPDLAPNDLLFPYIKEK